MKAYGGVAVHFHTFLTSALDRLVFGHFTPGNKTKYPLKGCYVALRADVDI
jgi:hypothetical protein